LRAQKPTPKELEQYTLKVKQLANKRVQAIN